MRILLLLVLSLAIIEVHSHECVHDRLLQGQANRKKRNSNGIQQQYGQTVTFPPTLGNSQSIRIIADTSFIGNDQYQCSKAGAVVTAYNLSDPNYPNAPSIQYVCQDDDVISDDTRDYLVNKLLVDAINKLQSALRVVPISGNMVLQSGSCDLDGLPVNIPSSYTSSGVPNVDMVVFVTVRPIISLSDTVLAYGGNCQLDQNNRPIAGQLNFNPSAINTGAPQYQSQLHTTMHETTHALGFTAASFAGNLFKVGMGQAVTAQITTNQYVNDAPDTSTTSIVTPKALAWAQQYFGCPTLQGVQLEDGGAGGTAGSHWEKRLFMNEYMTGTSSVNPIFSGLTLSLLEDSGWYLPDYTTIEYLLWGYGQGCSFAQKSCPHWSTDLGYFCDANSQDAKKCSMDRYAKAFCTLQTQGIPPDFQYFGASNVGGIDSYADWCPYPYSQTFCTDTTNSPSTVQDQGEEYCATCRCFDSTLLNNVPGGNPNTDQVCYDSYCTSNATLKVKVGSVWYDCPSDQQIEVITWSGKVTCPTVEAVCANMPTDDSWPVFKSVSPSKGEPGTRITISGSNFVNNSVVTANGPTYSFQFVSSSEIIVTLPDVNQIQNPSSLLEEILSIVITDPVTGKTAVGYRAFSLTLSLNDAGQWVKVHWYVIVIGALVIAALVLLLYCCCCHKKTKSVGPRHPSYNER